MKRHLLVPVGAVAAALVLTPLGGAYGAGSGARLDPNSDAPVGAGIDNADAIVMLDAAPLSTAPGTRNAKGRVDYTRSQTKSAQATLAAQRNDLKSWLRTNAPAAVVTGEHDLSLNAVTVKLNGTSLTTLRSAPHVVNVQYEALYTPSAAKKAPAPTSTATQQPIPLGTDPDLSLINAATHSATTSGAGVKVAVIDTGIDATHPCFSDAGYPAQTQLGDKSLTNNKVIVAKVFYNKNARGQLTPEALQDHGTHVAGTIACNEGTPATVNGVPIPYTLSGVAPKALLGNYNIFPGDVLDARSEDIVDALEAAYADGMDVANMSLGGGAQGIQDLLTIAVDNLDNAGMVVAVAAGNSGPGHYTVESPGSAQRALTAGASTVGHFVGAPVTAAGTTYGAAAGDFPVVHSDVTAPLAAVTDSSGALVDACAPLPSSVDLTGKIALVARGACSFSYKVAYTEKAGAILTLIANNVAGDPIAMATDPAAPASTIPAYMVSKADGAALTGANGSNTTVSATMQYFRTANYNIMAGFSGQGPTDADYRVKPDVVAPGVNVLSSIPHQFCGTPPCFAFFQGTSMATPHLAGSAAVLVGAHPTWTAAQVRSAVVNTAQTGVLTKYTDGTTKDTDVNIVGAGLEDLAAANAAKVAIGPVSTSFGKVPAGSGQTRTANVTLTNLSSNTLSLSLSVSPIAGGTSVTFSVESSSVSLAPGASATVPVTMTATKRAARGDHSATLVVGGGAAAHSVLYAFVG